MASDDCVKTLDDMCPHKGTPRKRRDCQTCQVDLIKEAHADGYRAGLRAAAKESDSIAAGFRKRAGYQTQQHVASFIAKSIRALATDGDDE